MAIAWLFALTTTLAPTLMLTPGILIVWPQLHGGVGGLGGVQQGGGGVQQAAATLGAASPRARTTNAANSGRMDLSRAVIRSFSLSFLAGVPKRHA
jgi:hypothetical protein